MTSDYASHLATAHALEFPYPLLDRILAELEPSTLAELDRVALMNRRDTKFLLAESAALSLLPLLADHYRVLDIECLRRHEYRTVYFDTHGWHLYEQHRADEPVRHKIRSRAYLDSGVSFLEIKSRESHGRTVKHRMPTPEMMTRLSGDGAAFVSMVLPLVEPHDLRVVLRNEFTRVTLVHRENPERLTLDFGLHFDHNGPGFGLPGVVIAEVKQRHFNPGSPFLQLMAMDNQQSSTVSKYCVGIARLNPELDREAFEPSLAELESITGAGWS